MLPGYCVYTQDFREHVPGGSDAATIEHWHGVMGDMFHHMHHYCYGLMKMNRGLYLSRDPVARRQYLQSVIPEFDYVLDHAPGDFFLTPEVLTRKAEVLFKLDKDFAAVDLLNRALELKRDYWAPYARLSDYYRDTGDYRKAREALTTGLSAVPDSKPLVRRLAELDAGEKKQKRAPVAQTSKPKATEPE